MTVSSCSNPLYPWHDSHGLSPRRVRRATRRFPGDDRERTPEEGARAARRPSAPRGAAIREQGSADCGVIVRSLDCHTGRPWVARGEGRRRFCRAVSGNLRCVSRNARFCKQPLRSYGTHILREECILLYSSRTFPFPSSQRHYHGTNIDIG